MRAWVLEKPGELVYKEVAKPAPPAGWVRLKVAAAGICGSDVPRIYGGDAHVTPLICGHEFAAYVDKAGEGVDPLLEGRAVGVFPLIPCGECAMCREKRYNLCSHYDYIGSRRDGAFAEYVLAPKENLLLLPEGVVMEEAAMLEPMAVAAHAMRYGIGDGSHALHSGSGDGSHVPGFGAGGGLLPKEAKILLCGPGTIGQLLLMFLLEAGYGNVYVIGSRKAQLDRAMSQGLPEERCLYFKDAAGLPADAALCFECVGKGETAGFLAGKLAPGGRLILVGNPHSDMLFSKQDYWRILRSEATVQGIWNSDFTGSETDDWHYVLQRLSSHSIHPSRFITHRLPFDQLDRGLSIMRDKTEDYCKVMLNLM